MCHNCGTPYNYPCNCVQQVLTPCSPYPCPQPTGCPILLDSACVIYHKNNSQLSKLVEGLGLGNGATLELILETISEKVVQLNFADLNLPFLDDSYVINTLQQFATAVDTQFSEVNTQIEDINTLIEGMGYLGALAADPNINDTEDGQYWWRTDLAANVALRIKVNGGFRTIPTTA
jgi:hypothetical protein